MSIRNIIKKKKQFTSASVRKSKTINPLAAKGAYSPLACLFDNSSLSFRSNGNFISSLLDPMENVWRDLMLLLICFCQDILFWVIYWWGLDWVEIGWRYPRHVRFSFGRWDCLRKYFCWPKGLFLNSWIRLIEVLRRYGGA